MANHGNNRLRIVLVGLGGVSEPHLLAYRDLPSVEIIGVVEPRKARLQQICEIYAVRGFESADALLAQLRPDVACILTPAATHRRLTEQFAQAGVHVLCEKPIAVTLEDALAMSEACSRAAVRFFYGSSYRFLPAVRRARELILGGAIGEVRLLTEQLIGGTGSENYQPMSAAHYPEGGPGGGGHGLVDHGVHMLDIFPWLIDSPISSALGRGDRTGAPARPEFALLTMQNGAIGTLTYDGSTFPGELPWEGLFSEGRSWVDGRGWVGETGRWERGPGNIQVYGTRGSLRIFHYTNQLFLHCQGRHEQVPVAHAATPAHFGLQMEQFRADLRASRAAYTPIEDGIRALRVLHAIYDSERAGCWQPIGTAGHE